MNLYLISGLGADRRAFQRIHLPAAYRIHHLDWIKPMPNESLDQYAGRLATYIDHSRPFALIGLSFGGMIATAMQAHIKPSGIILISSIGCVSELPPYFRWAGKLRLYKLIPLALLNHPSQLAFWLFGAKRPAEKKMLSQIITETDPRFIRWAFGAILTWKQKTRRGNCYHIHGEKDKILPLRYTQPHFIIPDGSHFIVWTKANAVSKAIKEVLKDVAQ